MTTAGAREALGLASGLRRQGVLALPAFGNPKALIFEPCLTISRIQVEAVLTALERAILLQEQSE